ncbi:PAS domain S-box protein [Geitlerinema splendidum]|nr:PAS domain S-box protein [Geitlerinema splendidum]
MLNSIPMPAHIQSRLGCVPPLFAAVSPDPELLENLWQQTQVSYLDNPLPDRFKNLLFAYLIDRLSRHEAETLLQSLPFSWDFNSQPVQELLATPLAQLLQWHRQTDALDSELAVDWENWSELSPQAEKSLLADAILWGLQTELAAKQRLQNRLTPRTYRFLIALLSYIQTCHFWAQSHLTSLNCTSANPLKNDKDEIHRLSQALQESEDRFLTCFEKAPTPMMIYAEDGEICLVNQVWLDLTGYESSELQTIAQWTQLGFGELHEIVRSHLEQLHLTLDSWREEGEFTITTRAGELRIWDFSFAPLTPLADGRRLIVAMAKDVTERLRLEQELSKWHERRFRAVFDQTFQFTGLLRPDGILLEVNQTALEFARLQADIIGQPFWEVRWWTISPETQVRLQEAIASAAKGELIRYEIDILAADDSVATIDFSIKPVTNDTGKVILLIPEGRDITEYKQTLAALEQAKEQLQTAIDAVPGFVAWIDAQGRYMGVNQHLAQSCDLNPNDFIAQEVSFFDCGPEFAQFVHEFLGSPETAASQVIATCIQGTPRYHLIAAQKYHQGNAIVTVGIDVTERQQAETVLRLAHTELEARVAERTAELAAINRSLQREINERITVEAALLSSESRLKLALSATRTGIWDWNLLDDSRSDPYGNRDIWTEHTEILFGLKKGEFAGTGKAFFELIHPEDRDYAIAAMRQAIETGQEYHAQYRIIWPDGSIHWLESKGQVVYDEAGKAVRMVGTDIDITDRKQSEKALQNLVAGTASVTGQEFFPVLVRHLAAALNVRYALVAEFKGDDPNLATTTAFWAGDRLMPNFTYDLKNTPCELVVRNREYYCFPSELQSLFPNDPDLKKLNAHSYFGCPLFSTAGSLIGHLFVLDDQPIINEPRTQSIMSIFAARASAELERQQTESALRQNERKYRSVVNNVKEVIFQTDETGTWTFLNPAWIEITGFLISESIGRNFGDYVHPSDRSPLDNLFKCLSSQEQPYCRQELRVLTRSGSYRWMEIYARLTRDSYQTIVGISGTLNDITERKLASDALRESEQRFRAIFNQAAVGMAQVALDGKWLLVNQKFCEIVDYEREELLQLSFRQITHPDDLLDGCYRNQQMLAGNLPTYSLEKRYLRKDGSPVWVDVTVSIVQQPSGTPKYFVTVIQDISDRKQAEQEIQLLNEQLEQRVIERTAQLEAANRELEAFSYSVSHDLRAPLRSIDGFSQVLIERYSDCLDDRGQHYLQRIRAGSQRMGELIDDLLSLSRVTRSEMQYRTVDLSAIATAILVELQARHPERSVRIAIAPSLKAQGDARLLCIVLENLLQNAWKYTSRCINAEIEFGAILHEENKLAYFVRDNGAGFDMAYAGKLFGAFQRLHTDAEFPGTGIGLATVQRIIHRHGGSVWAQSAVDRGATFFFTL